MFARFDEMSSMTLQDIKETKRYGRTDNVKTVYTPQTKFARGINFPWTDSMKPNQFSKLVVNLLYK